jgi:peptidoglycan/xylan/chitin deacetylase (PgdA/CDA1 family)
VSAISGIRKLRAQVLAAANKIGVNGIVAHSRWRRSRLLILCYHGVSQLDEHLWSDLYVSPAHLERRLSLLRTVGANVLPLDQAVALLKEGRLPELAVSITFDDGAADFATQAMPILASFDAPATLYLTTYYAGRGQPVFDTITSYLLWRSRGKGVTLAGIFDGEVPPHDIADPRFFAMHLKIRKYALDQGLTADEKDALARSLANAVRVDYDEILERRLLQIMTPEEIRGLDQRLVDIQLHTHRHRTPRDRISFLREIDDNAKVIRTVRQSQGPLNHFCYPSGDHIAEYSEWLRDAGVQWATTCDPGLATARSDPYFLPRFVDTEPVADETFLAWVSGLSMFAYARRVTKPVRL